MNILVVDDNKIEIELLRALLQKKGCHIVSAPDGAKGLEKLRSQKFDLIISDILMPVMDGFQFCLAVKKDDELGKIPFVFYTATYTDMKDQAFALAIGADRYFTKPVDPDKFTGIINGVIKEIKDGNIIPKRPVLENREETYKLYSERLVHKLEKKVLDLESALREKETLLRELHHRTKNNMQIISSLLDRRARSIEDEQILQIFEGIQNRIRSMSLIHEQLCHTQNLSSINLKDYIETLIRTLMATYRVNTGKISLTLDIENIWISIETAMPCGLIFNELISNALKHAFPKKRKGEVNISCHSADEKEINIRVSDNGVGLPENFDFRGAASMGLRLAAGIAERQLDGEMKLREGKGTEFEIKFKIPKYKKRI